MVLALRALWRLAAAFLASQTLTFTTATAAAATPESHAGGAVPAAAASWASERDVLEHLKRVKDEDMLELLRICIGRSWWAAARELIARGHARGAADGQSAFPPQVLGEVKTLLGDVKRSADEFGDFAVETYRGQTKGLVEVHCAVQWAQNSTTIFVGVKYAARWSAPGAIEVVDVKVNITENGFELEGFGHHSSIRKRYVVNLPLFEALVPGNSTWSAASVGRLTATLQKANAVQWPRLLKSKDKHSTKSQIGKWLDMQEKWDSELQKTEAPKDKKKRPAEKKEKAKEKSARNKEQEGAKRRVMKKLRKLWRRHGTTCIGVSAASLVLSCLTVWLVMRKQPPPDDATKRKRIAEAAEARLDDGSGKASPDDAAADAAEEK